MSKFFGNDSWWQATPLSGNLAVTLSKGEVCEPTKNREIPNDHPSENKPENKPN